MNELPQASAPAVGFAVRPAGHNRALRIVLLAAAALGALLLALIMLLLIGLGTGPVGLLVGFVLATLPVPIYIALALWIDRYEAEPSWALATAFLWGALVAVFIAFVANTAGGVVVAALAGADAGEFFAAVISAPVVEESAKALVLFGLFWWRRDEFDGVIDGIVYASMVGLGFAMTENIQYYGRAAIEGGIGGSLGLFILRGMMAPFSHPLFTSMTGIGLGLASQTTNRAVKLLAPVAGLLTAMTLHGLWNLSASINGLLYFIVYFFIMVPVFVAVLVTVVFALRREGRIVREQLYGDVQQGFFSTHEYEALCSVRGRMGASWQALTHGGYTQWRVRMRYNSTASELAFHRNRLARGLIAADERAHGREAAYRRMLADLSAQLQPRR